MHKKHIRQILNSKLDTVWQHLDAKELDILSKKFYTFNKKNNAETDIEIGVNRFISFANEVINNNINQRNATVELLNRFKEDFFGLKDKKKQNKIILKYSKGFVKKNLINFTSNKKLLKTLDFDAISECYNIKIDKFTRNNTAVYRIITAIIDKDKNNVSINTEQLKGLSAVLYKELEDNIPDITKIEILSALISLATDRNIEDINISQKRINDLLFSSKNTWIICNSIELLSLIEEDNFLTTIKQYTNIKNCDDIFVREFCVNLIIKNQQNIGPEDFEDLLSTISTDPAPFVRQALAFNIHLLSTEKFKFYFEKILLSEAELSVRCSVLKQCEKSFHIKDRQTIILSTIGKAINTEIDGNFQKYALNTIAKLLLVSHKLNSKTEWVDKFILLAEKMRTNTEYNIATRRFTANIKEQLWCFSSPDAYRLYNIIKNKIDLNRKKKTVKFSPKEFEGYNNEIIGRVLSIIAQKDFSFDLKKGTVSHKLTVNSTFCFRWWRFFHELRTPSPEKRQTTKHTTGRLFKGTIRASSGIMAEQSETKVPGEPLFIDEEGNARPYLPLVDEFISAAEYGKEVELFSSEGVTTITPPKGYVRRFISEVRLTFAYKKLAKLRNWQSNTSQDPASSYIEQIRKLGFSVKLEPFKTPKNRTIDPDVNKFFLPAVIPVGLVQLLDNLKIYFLSLYENTIYQLSVFIILFICFITGRHWFFNYIIKKARKSIPLVIGGWGTRGKSGTERIKAALFSALGCTVVSKTTGCEAMFLYTPNYGKTHELFLFRPYDKATIWEQFNLLKTASKLNADVFLWECMALSPPYVKVLQKDWMQDDYSTITNTYPDHEDLQGPAGWNIAETMTNFIPANSVLFTSEEQMFPILEVGAKKKNTEFFTINKFDTMLITPDILERFPYEEHPYNIELVLKMAEYLGVARQFALKEMADNVIPDIGVLKKYKNAEINNRNIEFYSGMSANERFGCMGNWLRMKFDQYTLEKNPDIYIATVVNNRSDRIARSKVFAQILVEDLSADKHFLIGNNLKGFMGYIKDAWNNKISDFTLFPQNEKNESTSPLEIFTAFAEKLRIPTTEKQVQNLLSILLKTNNPEIIKYWNNIDSLTKSPDKTDNNLYTEAIKFHKTNLNNFNKYIEISNKLKKSSDKSVDTECKDFFWKCFESKFVSVDNYYASGNEILKIISDSTPPNYNVKLMALQNIKGTGLDFFYRWQAWEIFSKLCDNTLSPDEKIKEDALTSISSYKEFDILWLDRLNKIIQQLLENKINNQNISALIEKIKNNLKHVSYDSFTATKKKEKGKLFSFIITSIENLLDPGDAVKRRKKSDKIYKDLTAGRISCTKAIKDLHYLTKRQKGGWLKSKKR